jgi:hypothetical protein
LVLSRTTQIRRGKSCQEPLNGALGKRAGTVGRQAQTFSDSFGQVGVAVWVELVLEDESVLTFLMIKFM